MYPILFHVGRFPVRAYGTLILIGFGVALWYASREIRRRDARSTAPDPGLATRDQMFDFAVSCLLISIAGARTLYILLNLRGFMDRPGEIVQVWQGGLSIHGAIVAGLVYSWWFCRRNRLRLGAFGDLVGRSFALGYAIGRVGCFLNGCCYGSICALPWAVEFHPDGATLALTAPSHPTQLYASAMNLLWFGILHARSRRPYREGSLFLAYLLMYSVYRFIDENFRRGATAEVLAWGLTQAQVASLLTIPVILVLALRLRARSEPLTSG